jgi:hypothetical protein
MDACKPCSIAAAVGFALDICQQENITVQSLQKIHDEGYKNDEEVLKALEEFNSKVPKDRRVEAKTIKCFAFPGQNGCKL